MSKNIKLNNAELKDIEIEVEVDLEFEEEQREGGESSKYILKVKEKSNGNSIANSLFITGDLLSQINKDLKLKFKTEKILFHALKNAFSNRLLSPPPFISFSFAKEGEILSVKIIKDHLKQSSGEIIKKVSKITIQNGDRSQKEYNYDYLLNSVQKMITDQVRINDKIDQIIEKDNQINYLMNKIQKLEKEIEEREKIIQQKNNEIKNQMNNFINQRKEEKLIKKRLTLEKRSSILQDKKDFVRWISQWTGGKKWRLQYRASRDGFSADDFHSRCDHKGSSLLIVQDKNGFIFGGFTTVGWGSSYGYVDDPNDFLFTLKNPNNIPPTKYPLKAKSPQPPSSQSQFFIPSSLDFELQAFPAPSRAFGQPISFVTPVAPILRFGGNDIIVMSNCNANESSFDFPDCFLDITGRGNVSFTGARNWRAADLELFIVDHN